MLDGGTNFEDAIALNEDFTRRDDLARFDVEEARGVENGQCGRVRLRERGRG